MQDRISTTDTQDLDRALLAAIIAGSEDAIISKTLNSIVTSWNGAAERLFGWTAAEMIGQPILRIIPPDMLYEEERILTKLRAGERVERYETTRIRKDGSRVAISLTISPIRDASGKVVGASKIAHDITERRRAEEAIAALADEGHALETLSRVGKSVASEFDLETIVQRVTDAATELSDAAFGAFFYNVIGREGEESYWLYSISGVPREKFANFPMPRATEVFAPTFRGEANLRSDDIRKDPRFGRNSPYHGMPEGHLPVVSYLAVPVISKSGEVIGGIFLGHSEPARFTARAERLVTGIASQAAIAIDNSRLVQQLKERESRLNQLLGERDAIVQSERAARSEAERLGHLKDEFLATLSHELRTPLHAVHGWTRVLLQGQKTEEQRKALEIIDRNVRAQTQIINDLLDMSRIISGKTVLEVQSLELHQVTQAALDTVKQTAEARNIRITAMLDSTIGFVRGDPNRLQQALWNLLTNAIKFTPAGGRVHVVLERVNSHVEISIEDTGIGIPADFLPFVFDRFRQADASTTRNFGGLGLGLSIVKNLIELHGGQVRVKSRGENQGSTFIVSLPVSHVHSEPAQVRPRAGERRASTLDTLELPSLKGARILVVDDEADGRNLVMRILSDQGAECVGAERATAALDLLQRENFDILLSDIGMPDMDGYELIREARALDAARSKPLPAIAITAYARPEDRQRSLVAGYASHLAKPIEPRELVATVAGLLRLMR
ncbi:MAG TPA: ATP-binding protein [Steroidobacteraceae bacterium]|nr:ATP-binding protein [Steroidobacteraceae bacterium]